jgi:leucyl-tRNA synthetase
VLKESCAALVLMISPFCPHFAEELWEMLGHEDGIVAAGWPAFDEAAATADAVEYAVQVNGKVRARLTVAADAPDAEIEAAARAHPQVLLNIEGRTIRKVVVVRGRLVGIVAN